mmetsp:Transcript_12687/g.18400  ORF Transcript_12687/g.18400 Transcript_12687/m.18400 type:complete len:277 (-) Transcript_12687:21-851(-)
MYFLDVTDDIKKQWGVMVDPQLGIERTRVLDQKCGGDEAKSEDLGEMQCGVLQWITRVQFDKIDRDKNGYVSAREYDLEYPDDLQLSPDRRLGFKEDWTFSRAADNGTDNGISKAAFDEAFEARDILLASIKDPLKRTFWTVCGIRKIGTPLSPTGVADPSLKGTEGTWLNVTSFVQLEDRKYRYTIQGMNDTDNRIYLINMIARNLITGEEVAYKVHAVQREVAVYQPPPIGGGELGLVVGISVLSATVAIVVVVAFTVNSAKKMRPRLRVRVTK